MSDEFRLLGIKDVALTRHAAPERHVAPCVDEPLHVPTAGSIVLAALPTDHGRILRAAVAA